MPGKQKTRLDLEASRAKKKDGKRIY